MSKGQWYQKRPIAESVLKHIGVKPELFGMLSEKIHEDDLESVAYYLDTRVGMLTAVLYKECEPPGGVKKGRVN